MSTFNTVTAERDLGLDLTTEVWTNKEINSFRLWAPQQPNDWKNEDCVHTLGAKYGYNWNDVPCTNCHNYTCFKGTKHKNFFIYVILYELYSASRHL